MTTLTTLALLLAVSPDGEVRAVVTASRPSAGDHIRQLVLDGDPESYFATEGPAGAGDHLTITFDRPVALATVAVVTGRPDGDDALDAGVLEGSADGETFAELAAFADGRARVEPEGRPSLRAIRVRPARDLGHPLAIREVAIVADPPVALFREPVEFTVDVDDAPDLRAWAESAALACERAYPMIHDELRSDGFRPPRRITMALKSAYKGVAEAGGTRITGSVAYFRAHPDDVGAMIHETAHLVQRYRGRGNPGWLVEGVADYVRFVRYEPAKIGPIRADRARYDGSYRVTAAFLGYLAATYDPEIVRALNRAMREGNYREAIFEERTGKPLRDLGEEWRATLGPR